MSIFLPEKLKSLTANLKKLNFLKFLYGSGTVPYSFFQLYVAIVGIGSGSESGENV